MAMTTCWAITVIVVCSLPAYVGCYTSLYFQGTLVVYHWASPFHLPIDYSAWLVAHGVLNMVMDVITLSLPLFVIRRLTLNFQKKCAVAGIFWLGLL